MPRHKGAITVDFRDLDSDSDAFAIVRAVDGKIAFSIGVRADGDLDLLLDRGSADRIAHALLSACTEADGQNA
jgi:hypothetical protein